MMENLAINPLIALHDQICGYGLANYPPGSSGHRRTLWTGPGDQLHGGKRVNCLGTAGRRSLKPECLPSPSRCKSPKHCRRLWCVWFLLTPSTRFEQSDFVQGLQLPTATIHRRIHPSKTMVPITIGEPGLTDKKNPTGGFKPLQTSILLGPLIHKNWSPESHWRALYTAWGWSLAGLRHLKHSQPTNCLTPGITRVSEGLVRHGWRNTEKSQQTKSKKMFTPCIVKVFPDPVWPYANKQPLYPWETAETCLSNVKLRNFRLSQAPSRTLWSNGLAVRSLEKLHI